ncbi:hypothetical protein T439DRAFT_19196 [Meredithblackwellia eburnea MCA 4105]
MPITTSTVPPAGAAAGAPGVTTSSSTVAASGNKRPPPLKLAGSNHATFLTPLLERPFKNRFGKDKGDKTSGEDEGTGAPKTKPVKVKKTRAEIQAEEAQARHLRAFYAQFPDVADEEDALAVTLNKASEMAELLITNSSRSRSSSTGAPSSTPPNTTLKVERVPVPSLNDDDARFNALFPNAEVATLPRTPPRNSVPHRRAASFDGSPKLQSASQFDNTLSNSARRSTTYSATSQPSQTSHRPRSRSRQRPSVPQLHSPPVTPTGRSASSPSIFSGNNHLTPNRATATPSPNRQSSYERTRSASQTSQSYPADAFYTPVTPTTHRTRQYSNTTTASAPSSPDRTTLGISVRDSAGEREVARAAYGLEGVTVAVRSAHRPEDVEVSWTSSPKYDEEGRLYTSWEIRIVPKSQQSQGMLMSSTQSQFSDYRLASTPQLGNRADFAAPASPKTSLDNSSSDFQPPPAVPVSETDFLSEPFVVRERKASHATSDLTGSSFSSESSGPSTPRRGKFDPLSGSISSSSDTPRRIGRSPSYASVAEQFRLRQQEANSDDLLGMRSGSISSSVGGMYPSDGLSSGEKKSPKHHRFGYFPQSPVTADLKDRITQPYPTTDIILPTPSPSASSSSDQDSSSNLKSQVPKLTPTRRSRHRISKSESALANMSPEVDLGNMDEDEDEDEDGDQVGDLKGPSKRDIKLSLARTKHRELSRWSDTDGETDEEVGPPPTSWSDVPDVSDESS